MKPIKKISATISKIVDLTPTAKALTLTFSESFAFTAGCFINVFFEHQGGIIRRAFSISSSDESTSEATISIRKSLKGELTPRLWQEDFTGREVSLMGPLGVNTADKMHAKKVYLFGFGIGAGVVKALAQNLLNRTELESLVIITGNRSDTEIVHFEYFERIKADPRVTVQYAISSPNENSPYLRGYIQDHLADYDFNNSDVYVCGQVAACDALQASVKEHNPTSCTFFVEAFH